MDPSPTPRCECPNRDTFLGTLIDQTENLGVRVERRRRCRVCGGVVALTVEIRDEGRESRRYATGRA